MERCGHGGDVYSGAYEMDYSSNVNPLGTPARVKEAICRSAGEVSCYPDVECRALRAALAAHEYLREDQILCGNGAAELIFAYVFALRPKKALLTAPSFSEYEAALTAAGSEISYYFLLEETGFSMEPVFLDWLSPDLDLLILCNPNNPTGVRIPQTFLVRIAEKCEKYGIFMMVDECFIRFLDAPDSYSMRTFLDRFPHLFVLNAFTKAYAMPGVRLGYGMTDNPDTIARMREVLQPWNVSLPAQYAGIAALAEEDYLQESRQLVRQERKYLMRALRLLGMELYDSSANFIFFQGPKDLAQACEKRGILIRDCGNYRGLGAGYFRICVRTRAENERLVSVLQDIMRDKKE